MLNSNWTATCNPFLPSIEGSLPENLAGRQPQFRGKNPTPKISVKNYTSAKIGWAVRFIDSLDAFIRHSSIE